MSSKLANKLWNLPIVQRTLEYLKKVILPGFKGHSLYEVGDFFYKSMMKEGIKTRSGSLAFSFFLALFPSILFLFTLVAFIPINNLDTEVLNQLKLLLPDSTFVTIESTLDDILHSQKGGLLSLGALMALYFSSNGIMTLFTAFEKRFPGNRLFFILKRLKSFGITILLALQIVVAIALIVAADYYVVWIRDHIEINKEVIMYTVKVLKFIILTLLIMSAISSIYKFCIPVPTKYRLVSPGSLLATFLSLVTTYGFNFYVESFNSYNKLYGSIGTIIALMILLYINCMSILIGFELNAGILEAERTQKDEIKA